MVPIGKRNRRITIQAKTLVKDADGYTSEAWQTVHKPWAWIQTTTGREFTAAKKIHAEMHRLFIIPYRAGLTTRHRILYDGRTYEILSAEDIGEARREIHISAKEVMPGG